jgi:hypothetical protein
VKVVDRGKGAYWLKLWFLIQDDHPLEVGCVQLSTSVCLRNTSNTLRKTRWMQSEGMRVSLI